MAKGNCPQIHKTYDYYDQIYMIKRESITLFSMILL
jgi:hypothetical protein